jgi:hypothetical protein
MDSRLRGNDSSGLLGLFFLSLQGAIGDEAILRLWSLIESGIL